MIFFQKNNDEEIWERPNSVQTIDRVYKLDLESFDNAFFEAFKELTGKKFDATANKGEAENLRKLVRSYILSDQEGFSSNPLLLKISENSLSKGLMILGDTGTGKTSIVGAFYILITEMNVNFSCIQERIGPLHRRENEYREWRKPETAKVITRKVLSAQCENRGKLRIDFIKSDDLVKEYEKYLRDKENIFDKVNSRGENAIWVIDDVLAERKANNFGDQLQTMKRIFEDMEYRQQPLIITANIHDNVGTTLSKMGENYGQRAYDRLFSCFNFVELNGNSLRK